MLRLTVWPTSFVNPSSFDRHYRKGSLPVVRHSLAPPPPFMTIERAQRSEIGRETAGGSRGKERRGVWGERGGKKHAKTFKSRPTQASTQRCHPPLPHPDLPSPSLSSPPPPGPPFPTLSHTAKGGGEGAKFRK